MSSPSEVVRLKDGRLLEYARCGHPAGVPALFFHGFIGSHNQARVAHEAALRHGITLIAPNRPGVGSSTPKKRQVIAEVVPDVIDLTAALGIDRFVVIGASGGAPYALACLAAMPERVRLAVLVSGLGPVQQPEALALMKNYARMALETGQRVPMLVRWFLALRTKQFHRDPEGFLDTLVQRWSKNDQTIFTRPEVREMFLADLNAVLQGGEGPGGLARELGMYFRWGFQLEDIAVSRRVILWHGTHDVLVPPQMSQFMAGRIAGAEVLLRPGGHFMVINHADEVMRHTLERLGP